MRVEMGKDGKVEMWNCGMYEYKGVEAQKYISIGMWNSTGIDYRSLKLPRCGNIIQYRNTEIQKQQKYESVEI